ncbi:hypothetical protein SISSUDRAFT_680657 [Sistotremastrum suecicum HHB10207 ss-3]|uniref:Uncharacterized protein n=1 Tax=Sistotremastrum suecicum HHB10207 ss-3 TaxID=1314776 RepID=A0A165WZ88_9AGAM|nr:hypothetical protein SISSUDRAFT_680657 [Sistotremastrum suecicum HHB10207 ss-3]
MLGNPEWFLRDAFTGSCFTHTTYVLSFIVASHQSGKGTTAVFRKGTGARVDDQGLSFGAWSPGSSSKDTGFHYPHRCFVTEEMLTKSECE